MPQRFLRPGLTNSDRWNAVSFPAQSLFVRLLTLVDDWGRYDGRVAVLHGQCFALRSDVKAQQTAGFRSELHAAGLIEVYVVEGKDFIQVTKWQERARGERSKYPDPPPPTSVANIPQDSAAERSGAQALDASLATTPSPLHPIPLHPRHSPDARPAWSAQDGWSGITDELRQRWKEAYPACEVPRQLLSMQEWLMANPARAKKSNWLKFITNWLAREQDRGGDQRTQHQKQHGRIAADERTAGDRERTRTGIEAAPIPTPTF